MGSLEQVLIGLAHGLARIGGPEEYVFVGPWRRPDWLATYLGPSQRTVSGPRPAQGRLEWAKRLLGPLRRPLGFAWRGGRRLAGAGPSVPEPTLPGSNGFYESLKADVLHLPYHFVRSDLPTVVTIHDLQHRHFPQFFNAGHLHWREAVLPAMFAHARAITTASRWVKRDLVRQYGVDAEKIYVVHYGSPTEAYCRVSADGATRLTARLRLPEHFALYPAMTYEHKNHLRLLEAVALLRDRGRVVTVVCTGTQTHFWPVIERRLREMRLERQVRFVGFLSAAELTMLYRRCRFMIFPTLFEGAGLPLVEALMEGAPVACSDIPPLREYGADSALFFDPQDAESLAGAMERMFDDEALRDRLRSCGAERIRLFSWEQAAMVTRAVYRRVAGVTLSDDDQRLLRESQRDDA